ncbi:MAG: methyltransferase domain-containing protein [Desulfovibrionales bacterium]
MDGLRELSQGWLGTPGTAADAQTLKYEKHRKIVSLLDGRKARTLKNGALCFLPGDRMPAATAGEGPFAAAKSFTKRFPRFYTLLRRTFSPVCFSHEYRKELNGFFQRHGNGDAVVNLGSGPGSFMHRADLINVDIFAFEGVDLVADAGDIPVRDGAVDAMLNISFLEHAESMHQVVSEMHRVLKPGGEILATIDFMYPFHSAPSDYQRLTLMGLERLFSDFKDTKTGVVAGPTSSMLLMLREWMATLLCFGSRRLYDLLYTCIAVLTFPVKYLDLLLCHYPFARISASCYYIRARKE